MTDMLTALLAAGAIPETSYAPNSRYYGRPVLVYTAPDGTQVRYVARRFIPAVSMYRTSTTYPVQQGDRIDLLSARFLGDPLLYWRISDANLAVRPDDPLVLGKALNIPLAAAALGGLV
jgi:nucleoid-associated protein YgaU